MRQFVCESVFVASRVCCESGVASRVFCESGFCESGLLRVGSFASRFVCESGFFRLRWLVGCLLEQTRTSAAFPQGFWLNAWPVGWLLFWLGWRAAYPDGHEVRATLTKGLRRTQFLNVFSVRNETEIRTRHPYIREYFDRRFYDVFVTFWGYVNQTRLERGTARGRPSWCSSSNNISSSPSR